ncbi:EVE domain-containing protein [Ornithinimicrobium sp. INDO-MA30-4]|uniref:EVE domain-containing protein n=1 Tax=Ornithinimicrobium sp. INDO-MA30-4 TaxID=2908651 RepID=UPI001F22646D|nr:EVE domain-containing protein [Ornithinimicrobium sp. INDO-MA30-4]UJH69853.1 EVE domain-containing protein [Ornithinimicrobium sp. INDO-MA30-4]
MTGWLGIISADHAQRGVKMGIGQIGHGKRGPLARLKAGDTLIYYCPTQERAGKAKLQQFTAFGTVSDDEIWQADELSLQPYRRRIKYASVTPTPLAEVKDHLDLTAARNWGYQLRLGLVQLSDRDVSTLATAMGVSGDSVSI